MNKQFKLNLYYYYPNTPGIAFIKFKGSGTLNIKSENLTFDKVVSYYLDNHYMDEIEYMDLASFRSLKMFGPSYVTI